jgi:hypothetical protein
LRDAEAHLRPGVAQPRIAADGTTVGPEPQPDRLNSPHGIAADITGAIYVVEWVVGGRHLRLPRPDVACSGITGEDFPCRPSSDPSWPIRFSFVSWAGFQCGIPPPRTTGRYSNGGTFMLGMPPLRPGSPRLRAKPHALIP